MISDKQMKILAFPYSEYDVLICDGAVRSGKTSLMVWAFIDWAMRNFADQRFGICGKTVESAVKNIITPFLSMTIAKERYGLKWRRGEHVLEVTQGNKRNFIEIFGGKDESSYMLIQGRTLAGVMLDEVVLMPESFVNQALARCSIEGSRIWFSCNPASPQHWFYTNWIQQAEAHNALYLHFAMTDNPALSEKVLHRYETMYSGVFYERYILGKWVLAEGLIYPMFNNECTIDGYTEPEKAEYYISCDYGTLNPFSAGLWCWDGKTATRIAEYYYSGRDTQQSKTDEEYYAELEKLAGERYIKSVIVDPSAASFIEVVRRHHRFTVRKAKNDVIAGINTTARYLQDGSIRISKDCKDCIREFGLYRWDDKSTVDKPIKENDHAMDDVRYFCYTILRDKVGKTEYKPLWAR
jgi:PBSX family phage terminase large subunit